MVDVGSARWRSATGCPTGRCAPSPDRLLTSFLAGLRFSRRCCAAVHGESVASALHLKDSPFWTLTPAYCEDIHIHDLRVTAPMDRIGNTDGVNIDSCRRVVVENVWISNSDDGVCMKSGLDGFGLNLGIPSEDVLVQNITCAE